jgi:uncharacterized membrane protein
MKRSLLVLIILACSKTILACTTCNKQIQDAIYNSTFFPNLFTMLSAFIVLAAIVSALSVAYGRWHKTATASYKNNIIANPVPLATAATILGIGLGGFIDGIVLHQVLQWHEMLSNKLPPSTLVNKSVNMFWDGVFHAFCLLVVFVGVILFWKLLFKKDIDKSGILLAGGLLFGWGVFNIVEGVIDHQLLKLHNVREITTNPESWNVGFLALSVIMLAAGLFTMKPAPIK